METIIPPFPTEMQENSAPTQETPLHELVDLMVVAPETVRECGAATPTHSINFRGDTKHECLVEMDKGALKTLLLLLLATVIRSSPAVHAVCLSVWTHDAKVMVIIEECGRSTSQNERVFSPFVSLAESSEIAHEDELELASIKRIADAYGAEVSMQVAPGQPAAFVVKFAAQKG